MVNSVHSFLRKIIPQRESISEHNHTDENEQKDLASYSSPVTSVSATPKSYTGELSGPDDSVPSTTRADISACNDILEQGITSNIATVALDDWGYPDFNDQEDINKFSGKYLSVLLKNYSPGGILSESPLVSIRANPVPKVDESDFSEYIRQVSMLYIAMEENLVNGYNFNVSANVEDGPSSPVSMEYYSEKYEVASNEIFKNDIENIPAIMASMERQLSTVNGELQELLERRYGHVREACTSVEELYKRFLDVTNLINNIRIDLEGGKVVVDETTTEQAEKPPLIDKGELECILESGVERKRSLENMLRDLHTLCSIAQMPEYIQGLSDSSGLALANIIRGYVLNYIGSELSHFKLAQSVASVISEAMSNVERVAETKFINLARIALVELSEFESLNDGVDHLNVFLKQLHQPLIALLNASSLQHALDTLEQLSADSKATFKYKSYENWDELYSDFGIYSTKVIKFVFLSHVWGCMIMRRVICIELSKTKGEYLLSPEESNKLIRKILSIIQDRQSDLPQTENMASLSHISTIIRGTISLPEICGDKMDFGAIFENGIQNEGTTHKRKGAEAVDATEEGPYVGYVETLMRIISSVTCNTVKEFAGHFQLQCRLTADSEIHEFVDFIDRVKDLKGLYGTLLSEIHTKGLFDAMLSEVVSRELKAECHSQNQVCFDFSGIFGTAYAAESLYKCKKLANQALQSIASSCLEPLKLSNIISLQKVMADEKWEEYKSHDLSDEQSESSFALVGSSFIIDERLRFYHLLADVAPSFFDDIMQDCVQLVALYNSMLDAETSVLQSPGTELDSPTIIKLCLMAESLRYFSMRVIQVLQKASTAKANHDTMYGQCEEDESLEKDGKAMSSESVAEKCSDDLETLKQRNMHIVSTDIGMKMRSHMIIWVLQSPDVTYDDTALRDMINVVQESVDLISAIMKDVTDVQMIFEVAFQQLNGSIPKEEIANELTDYFRDSCTELITGLSHNTCIKLEVFWLAETLSNELFS